MPHKPTDLFHFNDKDSVLQPPLSGFLGLGVSVATLLLRWTHGQRTRVAGYGHQQPTSTPRHHPSAKLSGRAQKRYPKPGLLSAFPGSIDSSQKQITYEKKSVENHCLRWSPFSG